MNDVKERLCLSIHNMIMLLISLSVVVLYVQQLDNVRRHSYALVNEDLDSRAYKKKREQFRSKFTYIQFYYCLYLTMLCVLYLFGVLHIIVPAIVFVFNLTMYACLDGEIENQLCIKPLILYFPTFIFTTSILLSVII